MKLSNPKSLSVSASVYVALAIVSTSSVFVDDADRVAVALASTVLADIMLFKSSVSAWAIVLP